MKVRFAPSPTGWLHVGNARIALINWLLARRHGGAVLLRMDDTDAARSTDAYARGIEDDLRWLGLDWDESDRQSDRLDRYAAARARLEDAGRLYPCFESEEELRFKRDLRAKRGQPPVYDRAMLHLTAAQRAAAEAGGKRPYFRFRLTDGAQSWVDLIGGPRTVKLTAVSDPVVIRADGTPLYTFCSIVDDLADGVSHIVRGEDHVTNTGIQLDIASALGANPSLFSFGHVPLSLDEEGAKLSKRVDGLAIRRLRTDGIEAGAITSYLARLGSSENPEPLALPALVAGFAIGKLSASPARFDIEQLQAMNRRVLQAISFAEVADRLPDGATAAFWELVRGNLDRLTEARRWWDVIAGDILPTPQPEEAAFLAEAARLLPDIFGDDPWTAWTTALREATGRKGKTLFMPLRLALTGEEHGPDMKRLLPMMGRGRVARRLGVSWLFTP